MKKTLIFLLVLALIFCLCACKSSEVKDVEALIAVLAEKEDIGLDELIEAKEAYDNLSEQDQEKVDNYSVLKDAFESCYISLVERMKDIGDRCDTVSTDMLIIWNNVGPDNLANTLNYIAFFSLEDATWDDYVELVGAMTDDDSREVVAKGMLIGASQGILGEGVISSDKDLEDRTDELLADCLGFNTDRQMISDNYEGVYDDATNLRSAFRADYPEEMATLNEWNTALSEYAELCLTPSGSYVTYSDTVNDYSSEISRLAKEADSYF